MRAMRKLATFYRKQAVFGGVMERDDEGRALQTCIATLEKVESPFARRRIVRYLVERYVSPEEDVHALAMGGITTVHMPEVEGRVERRTLPALRLCPTCERPECAGCADPDALDRVPAGPIPPEKSVAMAKAHVLGEDDRA